MTIRIIRTYALPYSQRFTDTWQQWIKGEWQDVGMVVHGYALPDGRTK